MSWFFPLNCKSGWGVGIVEISLKAGRWCDRECELEVLSKQINISRSAMAKGHSTGGRLRGRHHMDDEGLQASKRTQMEVVVRVDTINYQLTILQKGKEIVETWENEVRRQCMDALDDQIKEEGDWIIDTVKY